MNSIMSIALSGMQAARQRLEVASNNIANAATTGALPVSGGTTSAYQPQRVDQHSVASGGVATTVSPVDPAIVTAYQPDSPQANQDGQVAAPNVDLVGEVINQRAAFQAYQASARLVGVANELDKTLLGSLGTKPHGA
jgi:flagellar basal-body rod protein FlgC